MAGLRAAYAGRRTRAGLLIIAVVAIGLWLFAHRLFSTAPLPDRSILVYRIDANDIAAYPRSDAAMDYLNGMAILSGDGWVNWRSTNRWSVYRPGWGAFLGGLGLLTGGEPQAMQGILTFLLAATAPAFMLLLLTLYAGRHGLLLALLVTVLWLLKPFFDWTLHRTMMSEGPAMLLGIAFCLLAVRFGGRLGEWTWRQGLVLGLVAGALSMVREQSRFGVLAVVALLALVSVGRLRRRLPFFVALACGLLILVGPVYLKTSIHLRLPYAGTSYLALFNTLEYTPVGRQVGGTRFADGAGLSEREATKLLQQRVGQGLRAGLGSPGVLRDGFLHFSRAIYGSVATLVDLQLPPPKKRKPVAVKLLALYALAGLGLFFAWRRSGPMALAPLAFAAGYFLPTVPFWFYSNRLGLPISWVGLVYVAGAVLILDPRGAGTLQEDAGSERRAAWPGRRFFALVGAWLTLATAVLLWMDLRPLGEVDVERLFADPRSREVLERAGIAAEPGVVEEADRLLNRDGESDRLLVGVALLPMTIAPGDAPVLQPFSKQKLPPGEEAYDLFYLVSPWKRGGDFEISRVRLAGGGAAEIRPGDEVIVVRAPDSVETVGKNLVVQREAVAALPTRWAR